MPNKINFKGHRLLMLSLFLLFLFSLFVFIDTQGFYDLIESWSIWIRKLFGKFYLVLGLLCTLMVVALGVSPLGKRKIGGDFEQKEFSNLSWIAMLYSTGMGAGIILRAVQEPVYMFSNPPIPIKSSAEILALEYTFYQWGFTPWAFYSLFALIIGFYIYNKKLPSLASSFIKPSLDIKPLNSGIDVLVILTTVFGLIGAIALGTTQLSAGVDHISSGQFGFKLSLAFTLLICGIAFLSVWNGIEKGIKVISRLNIGITTLLLVFVLFQNEFLDLIVLFGKSIYYYVIDFIPLSLATRSFNPGTEFLTDWTYYYWAFWLAWAPFTGIFIARISRGRSIREILMGVLIVPSLGTFLWFTSFGNAAFDLIAEWGSYSGQFDNVFSSIFEFFDNFSFSTVLHILVVTVLVGFLVTSVDSAIYVLSMFTDKGNQHPKKSHRALWAIFLFVFCLSILFLGEAKKDINVLTALQKLLIITSLPFAFLLLIMAVLFIKDLRKEKRN